MTEKGKKLYRTFKICRFSEKTVYSHKVRDHCHSTGKYKCPAHKKSKITLHRQKIIVIHFYLAISVNIIVI